MTVGSPTVAGASVSATVLGEALGPKIVVFKFKQKVKYRRRTGHRQHLTRLRIDSISADGKTVKAQPPEPAAPKAAATPARTPRRAVKAQAAKGATIVDLSADDLAKWRAIAEASAWKEFSAKSSEAAELLASARSVA